MVSKTPRIDDEAIAILRQIGITRNRPHYGLEILKLFNQQSAPLLTKIEQAINAQIPDQICSLSHKLKGSALSIGATELAHTCTELQKSVTQKKINHLEIKAKFEDLTISYTTSLPMIEQRLRQPNK